MLFITGHWNLSGMGMIPTVVSSHEKRYKEYENCSDYISTLCPLGA